MTTIVDIAKKLNISKSTVSRVLTSNKDVNPKTREMVLAAAREMHYVPNVYARNLVSSKTNLISFMMPTLSDPYFQRMADGVEKILCSQGYRFIYQNVRRNADESLAFLRQAVEFNVDGVFITTDEWTDEICEQIKKMKMPIVSLRRKPAVSIKDKVSYVDYDYADAIEKAVEFILSYNHKEIGYIGQDSPVENEKIENYKQICKKKGLNEYVEKAKPLYEFENEVELGYELAKNFLERYPEVTAVLCADDHVAIGVLEYCSENGIAVPGKMSVMGCDDRKTGGLYCFQLTTMDKQEYLLGETAGNLMLDLINKQTESKIIKLPMSIKKRRTVDFLQ